MGKLDIASWGQLSIGTTHLQYLKCFNVTVWHKAVDKTPNRSASGLGAKFSGGMIPADQIEVPIQRTVPLVANRNRCETNCRVNMYNRIIAKIPKQ